MPANLPPQYYEAERRYRSARGEQEKIAILYEMLAIMPKHKGTDKLQAELRAKISRLKRQIQKKRATPKKTYGFHIPKQGAGQVALIGAPNTGKSQIVQKLTNISIEVAPYPFTTREPVVGMMKFENIKIQLIDTPPITGNFIEPYLPEIIRNADLILFIVDLASDGVLEETEEVKEKLRQFKIELGYREKVDNQREGWMYKRTMMVGNKIDLKGAHKCLEILRDLYEKEFPITPISAKEVEKLNDLKREIYKALNIIRVYTKIPGKPADLNDPIVLKKGSTVIDAAVAIHKDFVQKLKYARIWDSDKFNGQRIDRDSILKEGDILEFHI